MKRILSERNIVVILFILVLASFSFAQEDVKKMEKMNAGTKTATIITTSHVILVQHTEAKSSEIITVSNAADRVQ